ncbi:MAG TPA: iron ABC transporter permease [Thermomicrobiales bacterium]|nr:iron ABC transporter permease [Thermomicrobiales bacterium]
MRTEPRPDAAPDVGRWRELAALARPTAVVGEESAPLPGLRRVRWPAVVVLALLLVVTVLLAAAWGSVRIPLPTIARMVAARLHVPGVTHGAWPASYETIIFTIRLPRVILAGLVGAALAVSGATYQGLFRNPLADPYLIGVASGAALGATIAAVLPLPLALYHFGATQWCAFTGALIAVGAVYGLARVGGTTPLTTLLLAGVAVSALASAMTSFLMYWHGEKLLAIYGWILGGFTTGSWRQTALVVPYLALGSLVLLPAARLLNALQLGEEGARALGIDVEKLKLILVITATLMTAAAVSVSGLIAFVGLIVPHIVRLIWGPDHRTLLPLSLVAGAIFLIVADGLARSILAPGEIPVGVLTALCGAPFFLYLLRRGKRQTF